MPLFKSNKMKDTAAHTVMPSHIGLIMDGNGRWAKRRGLPRSAGHKAGAEAFRKIARYGNKIGLKYMTVYMFSTENWARPKDEIDYIMNLFRDYLKEAIADFKDENIKTRFIGDTSVLDSDLQKLIIEAEEASANATGMTLNIAVNYGGRQEIAMAVKKLCRLAADGAISPDNIDEKAVNDQLFTAGQPDPDIIVRPSGEQRISNFMLWQSAYSEFIYMDVLWPDFTPRHLDAAIAQYSQRSRRFGGL